MAPPARNMEESFNALIECLVDPSLANRNHYAGSSVGEDDIAKQMEAVAWLYNQYLCEESPNLKPLDWLSIRKTAIVLRPALARFMNSPKTSTSSVTLTEMKIKNACAMSEALKNLKNGHESFPVSKVSVCLLNARRDKFVLVLGGITCGVWSFIEKTRDIDLSRNFTNEGNHSDQSEETLAFTAVQEQTGIKSSLLHIEDSFLVNDCMNQAGGGTKFYIFSCFGTFDLCPTMKLKKVVWVSVNAALCSADGHLLENTPSGVRSTSALQYFHLRPFRSLVRNWFMRQFKLRNLEKLNDTLVSIARDEKLAHLTSSGLVTENGFSVHEAGRHLVDVNDKSVSETVSVKSGHANEKLAHLTSSRLVTENGFSVHEAGRHLVDMNDKSVSETVSVKSGHANENNGDSKLHAGLVSENALLCYRNQNTFSTSEDAPRVADFHESSVSQYQHEKVAAFGGAPAKEHKGLGTLLCPDNTEGHNRSVNLETSKQQKTDIIVPDAEAPHEPTNKSACTRTSGGIFQVKEKVFNQEINATDLHLGSCECNPSPESSTQMKTKQEECFVDDVAGFSSQQAALQIVNDRRKCFNKELMDFTIEYQTRVNRLNKQISECDANLTTLLEGGKAAEQLAVKLCSSTKQKEGAANDITKDQQKTAIPVISIDQQGEASTKRRCLSKDPFRTPRSSIQDLSEICLKNKWSLPSYGVFNIKNQQKQNLFSGKVRVRGSNFELSETGELCDSVKAAKASAAACMLSALYLIRSRGSML